LKKGGGGVGTGGEGKRESRGRGGGKGKKAALFPWEKRLLLFPPLRFSDGALFLKGFSLLENSILGLRKGGKKKKRGLAQGEKKHL